MGEIIIILIVAVLVLGPEKLPSTLVQVAKVLKALKKQVDDAKESIEKEVRLSEIKKEADKYKNEFSEYNENIRKKLSFEEFDELKNSVNKGVEGIKDSLKFGNSSENSANSSGNLAENSVNSSENSAIGLNSVAGVSRVENAGAAGADTNSGENLAENSANSAAAVNSAGGVNSINENADFSTPNGKISRAKAQMLGLDILENSSEYSADFGNGEKSSAQTTSRGYEPGVNSIADDSEIIAKNSKTKATNSQISTPKIRKSAAANSQISAKNSRPATKTAKTISNKSTKNSANSAQNPRPKTAQVKIKKSPKAEKPNV